MFLQVQNVDRYAHSVTYTFLHKDIYIIQNYRTPIFTKTRDHHKMNEYDKHNWTYRPTVHTSDNIQQHYRGKGEGGTNIVFIHHIRTKENKLGIG